MSENMFFCLGEGQSESKGIGYQKSFMVFNQQLTESEYKKVKSSIPEIKLPINYWIDKKEMTKEEKDEVSGWSEMGGYLKRLDYEEAWAKWWSEAKSEDKEKILAIPQFDSDIFTEITGLTDFKTDSLKGAEVEVKVNGKSYKAIIQ